jgi:hypothetical protein
MNVERSTLRDALRIQGAFWLPHIASMVNAAGNRKTHPAGCGLFAQGEAYHTAKR